ncbi:MAG: hypothetical protein FWF02_14760 [Micrococcales bacterium]|nr:hypothetical protein [Micrococcales bacterium]MCL2668939.1 hypothetical protein [Micrococcales bacterium]
MAYIYPPGPPRPYAVGYHLVQPPRPRTVTVLLVLGIVFGSLTLIGGAITFVGFGVIVASEDDFRNDHLSVHLEDNQEYVIEEILRDGAVPRGKCEFTGPDDALATLTPRSPYSESSELYTFITDTPGVYDFTCRDDFNVSGARTRFVLRPSSMPNDEWQIILLLGTGSALFLLLLTCLATLIPGLVLRSRLQRYRAMTMPPRYMMVPPR